MSTHKAKNLDYFQTSCEHKSRANQEEDVKKYSCILLVRLLLPPTPLEINKNNNNDNIIIIKYKFPLGSVESRKARLACIQGTVRHCQGASWISQHLIAKTLIAFTESARNVAQIGPPLCRRGGTLFLTPRESLGVPQWPKRGRRHDSTLLHERRYRSGAVSLFEARLGV